jgi:hypothetical protein
VLLCLGPAGAQTRFSLESPLFLPSAFFVGDTVEMRVLIRTQEEVKEPAQVPNIGWGVVHELRIVHHGDRHELKIFFTPYMPGTQTFPPMKLGGVALGELKVHVRSLIEDGYAEPAPPRPQMVLPGTRLIVGLLFALGLAVPLAVFLALRFGRGLVQRTLGLWRRRFPQRQLRRTLNGIAARRDSLDSRGFYFLLLAALKSYLTARLGLQLASATTQELMKVLPGRVENPEFIFELEELLSFGDEVKFGGRTAAQERRQRDLSFVGRIEYRFAEREKSHADL